MNKEMHMNMHTYIHKHVYDEHMDPELAAANLSLPASPCLFRAGLLILKIRMAQMAILPDSALPGQPTSCPPGHR